MGLKDEMLALAPKLRAHAWALTGGANHADDLVQETLMHAWRWRRTFQPGSNFKAWMFRILRNAYLAGPSTNPKFVHEADGRFTGRLSHRREPEWRLRFDDLLGGLAKLPEQHREALLLVAGSGLTYEEAAAVCGCAVGTVKSRVSRARKRLIEALDADLLDARPSRPAARTGVHSHS